MLEHHRQPALARRKRVDPLVVEDDFAGVGGLEPGDDPQQGRLARSRWTEKGDEFTRAELEIDSVEDRDVFEGFSNIAKFKSGHGAYLSD